MTKFKGLTDNPATLGSGDMNSAATTIIWSGDDIARHAFIERYGVSGVLALKHARWRPSRIVYVILRGLARLIWRGRESLAVAIGTILAIAFFVLMLAAITKQGFPSRRDAYQASQNQPAAPWTDCTAREIRDMLAKCR